MMQTELFIRKHLGNNYPLGAAFVYLVGHMRSRGTDRPQLRGAEAHLLEALSHPEDLKTVPTAPSPETLGNFVASGMSEAICVVVENMARAAQSKPLHDRRAYLEQAVRVLQETM